MTAAAESVPGFEWFPGIPSRNSFCYGQIGDTRLKVTHLVILRLLLVEEIGPDRLPIRTLTSADVGRDMDRAAVEAFLTTMGIRP